MIPTRDDTHIHQYIPTNRQTNRHMRRILLLPLTIACHDINALSTVYFLPADLPGASADHVFCPSRPLDRTHTIDAGKSERPLLSVLPQP